MKNTGFEAWKARLDWFGKEFPFGPIQKFCNEEGRLHRDNGPAYISPTRITWYQNGRKHGIDADKYGSIHFYYENIRIPKDYFYKPEALLLSDVLQHPNSEVRYVGIKIIGLENILNDKLVKVLHTCDKTGMVLFKIDNVLQEPVFYLKVINSTQELDGSYKNYFLTVPPTMKTCKQAVAWTFGLEENDYHPTQET